MDNKRFWLGMLVITLVFGMTVLGCDDSIKDKIENSYNGDWSGTFTKSDGTEVEATIVFTDTTWTLKVGTDVAIAGTYTKTAVKATLSTDVSGSTYPVATASILLSNLTVTFNYGTYNGSSGSFTRVKDDTQTDPFIGTWNGTLSASGETAGSSATIAFTDTAWTLTVGSDTSSGTYTKSTIGYTAELKTADGLYPVGTCIVNPVKKELTVNITGGTQQGKSGKFTRP